MHKYISKRAMAIILVVTVLVSVPFSVLALTATPDEAVRVSTPDSAVHRKKQPVSSGSSQGGIYISRNSEDGENYHKLGITVSQSTDCTYDESSDTYNFLTGKSAQINISLSNQNSADEYRFARVYFKFGDTKGVFVKKKVHRRGSKKYIGRSAPRYV